MNIQTVRLSIQNPGIEHRRHMDLRLFNLPRIGDFIFWKDRNYRVTGVAHWVPKSTAKADDIVACVYVDSVENETCDEEMSGF